MSACRAYILRWTTCIFIQLLANVLVIILESRFQNLRLFPVVSKLCENLAVKNFTLHKSNMLIPLLSFCLNFSHQAYFVNWLNAYSYDCRQHVRLGEVRSCKIRFVFHRAPFLDFSNSLFLSTYFVQTYQVFVVEYADDVTLANPFLKTLQMT